jgi:hypothetical protein
VGAAELGPCEGVLLPAKPATRSVAETVRPCAWGASESCEFCDTRRACPAPDCELKRSKLKSCADCCCGVCCDEAPCSVAGVLTADVLGDMIADW